MSEHKERVLAYFEGFRQGDHARILSLLSDDVVWDIVGYRQLAGKDAFDREIANEAFTGKPTLDLDRLIEEGDTIAAIGMGAASLASGDTHRFAFCTVFTFATGQICRVESYLVPLAGAN